MADIHQYLITVISAALLCGIINGLFGKKGTNAALIQLITGLFMVLTVISPWTKLNLTSLSELTDQITLDADSVVKSGEELAQNQMDEIIIQKTEAYILDKAASLGLDICVDVSLSNDVPAVPNCIAISGAASPYAKKLLTECIENDLAIPKENQLWT